MRLIERSRADLRSAARALPRPDDLMAAPRQRLDLAAGKLANALVLNSRKHDARLQEASRRLARLSPQARLAGLNAKLEGLGNRLVAARESLLRAETIRLSQRRERLTTLASRGDLALRGLIERRRTRVANVWQLAESYSYRNVLARGFALVRGEDGQPVRSAGTVSAGAVLEVEFHDGKIRAIAGEGGKARPSRTKPADVAKAGQGSLFGS